jgi:hypothetical protein
VIVMGFEVKPRESVEWSVGLQTETIKARSVKLFVHVSTLKIKKGF